MERGTTSHPPPAMEGGGNRQTLFILQNLYGGRYGKLTAALQYYYQVFTLGHCQPELARMLKHLAQAEMNHLEILGGLIARLGGVPAYQDARCRPWSGQYVCCMQDSCKMLLRNLRDEVESVDAYLSAAKRVDDSKVCDILWRIAQDEAAHAELLRRMVSVFRCSGRQK